ncbi:MAG: nitroreductase [Desulfobacca sp.]|uniref:nitroreductase n=1 Tax=Desulfobacca sp. TaxID=2067990 RepID=UPI00404A7961
MELIMDVRQAIYQRRSIRAFRPEPVPNKTLLQLLDAAVQAPSARNMQPWHFVVVTGKARERLVQRLLNLYEEEVAQGLVPEAVALPEPYQTRVHRFLEALQPYSQTAQPFDLMRGSLAFYGAPAVILVALDQRLSPDRLFDLGAAVQNLLLLAPALGLGTCVIGIALRYKSHICEELQLPQSINPMITVAVGKPDPDHPITAFRATREDLSAYLTWIA